MEETRRKRSRSMSDLAQVAKKQCIPRSFRDHLWVLWYGPLVASGKCVCCGIADIRAATFVHGHVVPECEGGAAHIDNLRPICKDCNNGMGARNMDAYMWELYGRYVVGNTVVQVDRSTQWAPGQPCALPSMSQLLDELRALSWIERGEPFPF